MTEFLEEGGVAGRGENRDLDEAVSRKWYGKRHTLSWLTTGHEPTLWEAITHEEPYPVKALIVQGHNAVGACANAGAAMEAFTNKNLEPYRSSSSYHMDILLLERHHQLSHRRA